MKILMEQWWNDKILTSHLVINCEERDGCHNETFFLSYDTIHLLYSQWTVDILEKQQC